jgi:hypothetical protein
MRDPYKSKDKRVLKQHSSSPNPHVHSIGCPIFINTSFTIYRMTDMETEVILWDTDVVE